MTTGATGAPLEQKRTVEIGLRLVDLLRANGFDVYHTDAFANNNPAVTGQDWDLFLSLHCDANYAGNEGGGFVDYPDPSVDSVNAESKRIKEAMESVYFTETGIRNVPGRSNPNTKYYYMWSALSAKTPCVIIEMGESIDPHDSVILNDTNRVAQALLRGIIRAFPLPVVTPPVDPCLSVKAELTTANKTIESLKIENSNKDKVITDKDKTISDLTKRLASIKALCS